MDNLFLCACLNLTKKRFPNSGFKVKQKVYFSINTHQAWFYLITKLIQFGALLVKGQLNTSLMFCFA